MRIGNRQIGDGAPVYVIAEIGVNHEGRVDLAPYPGVCRWVERVKALPRFVGVPGV